MWINDNTIRCAYMSDAWKQGHYHFFMPTSTYGLISFQCGCGLYRKFTIKEYCKWLKDRWGECQKTKMALDKLMEIRDDSNRTD